LAKRFRINFKDGIAQLDLTAASKTFKALEMVFRVVEYQCVGLYGFLTSTTEFFALRMVE
jgi:hypothetical protein